MDIEGLKKLIRKAEVDNTANRIKAGEFKARPETESKPKAGSQPMTLTPKQQQMLANLPAGTAKNRFRVDKPGETSPYAETPNVTTAKKRLQRLLDAQKKYSNYNKYNTPSPGDVDPETGDVIPESVENTRHTVHVNVNKTGFRRLERKIASLDGYRESDHSDGKARFYFDANKHDSAERKKAAEFIKNTRGAEFSHAVKESVQKAGHPEAFELGLDAETMDNPEYQKILRQKRVERAKQMLNPKLVTTASDDVSQDDVEAADRAARRRKRIGEAMGKFDPRNVGKDAY